MMKERFEKFTVLIAKVSRNIRKLKNMEMAQYGLKSHHISCLYYLYTSAGLSAKELCEKCEEDKATISRSLDFLETNGFITCKSVLAKRYKSPLILTEKGRTAACKIAEKVDRILDEVGMGMSDAERESFYRSLTVISDNLDRICAEEH